MDSTRPFTFNTGQPETTAGVGGFTPFGIEGAFSRATATDMAFGVGARTDLLLDDLFGLSKSAWAGAEARSDYRITGPIPDGGLTGVIRIDGFFIPMVPDGFSGNHVGVKVSTLAPDGSMGTLKEASIDYNGVSPLYATFSGPTTFSFGTFTGTLELPFRFVAPEGTLSLFMETVSVLGGLDVNPGLNAFVGAQFLNTAVLEIEAPAGVEVTLNSGQVFRASTTDIVPEPSSLALLAAGAMPFLRRLRRRQVEDEPTA
jgi:hypothetical protein